MRDRLASAARRVEYQNDLSELTVFNHTWFTVTESLLSIVHHTELGHGYDTLDELTQLLFIFEKFDEIIGSEVKRKIS